MGTVECEVGLFVVVEAPEVPAIGVVAVLATGSEVRLVKVIFAVAVAAQHRRVMELLGRMALLAGRHLVQPKKREAAETMIEKHVGGPSDLAVAISALAAQLLSVYVIVKVARCTCSFDRNLAEHPSVTAYATHLLMDPVQREVGFPVIELFVIPGRHTVTLLTTLAEAPLVLIIGFVAREAAGTQLHLIGVLRVACLTAQPAVGSLQ